MEGICKLTGKHGKFVKSHILPKALTKLNNQGIPYTEYRLGENRKRAWDSWYDIQLVTQEGENILSEYDDWGIKFLRDNGLVWSSPKHSYQYDKEFPIIHINLNDPNKLKIFFLSILWRACESSLNSLANINMGDIILSQIKYLILNGSECQVGFLPISLIMLSKEDNTFNYSPTYEQKECQYEGEIINTNYYRLYLDGLVVMIHDTYENDIEKWGCSPFIFSKELLITQMPFEHSYQKIKIEDVKTEYKNKYED